MTYNRITGWRAYKQYVRLIYPDLALLTTICGGVYQLSQLEPFKMYERVFPMWFNPSSGLWEGEIQYSYPHLPYVLNTIGSAIAIGTIPIGVVLIMQIWVRSFWDANAAIWGIAKSITLMLLFQFVLKQYIGGFRPYFLAVCNPNPERLQERLRNARNIISAKSPPVDVQAYHRVFATVKDCQTIDDKKFLRPAMQSFPSGHSGMAFAAGVFLSLYLNAKLKALADYHTTFVKLLVVLSPLIGATFIAGNLMIDHNHHPSDILIGALLGSLFSLISYRSHYASLFASASNHIPLPYPQTFLSFTPHANLVILANPRANGKGQYVAVKWPRACVVEEHQEGDRCGTGDLEMGMLEPATGPERRVSGAGAVDGAGDRERGEEEEEEETPGNSETWAERWGRGVPFGGMERDRDGDGNQGRGQELRRIKARSPLRNRRSASF